MNETMIVRGFVATEPALRVLESGLHVVSFRLGSTPRRFDKATSTWVDGETSWYTVSCFRELAVNAQVSLKKGQPVIVLGRLKVRQFARSDGSPGVSVELDAETLGHDLRFGAGTFGRTHREQPAAETPDGGAGASDGAGAADGAQAPDRGLDGADTGATASHAPGYAGPPSAEAGYASEDGSGQDEPPGDADDFGADRETGEIAGAAA